MRSEIVLLAVVSCCVLSLSSETVNAQCEGDIPSLISQCAKYVRPDGPKIQPSEPCCAVAKKAQLPCLCKYVTKDIEKYVNIGKVVYVAQYCGVPLQHGSKCGSFTIPTV